MNACEPNIEASAAKVRRKCFLFQHLKHLRARSAATTAEFGVFRGQSSMIMMSILDRQEDRHHIFDSFARLSEKTELDTLPGSTFGEMRPDIAHIRPLMPNAIFHSGWIPAELPNLDERFDFAHVDLDLHGAVSGALEWIHERRDPERRSSLTTTLANGRVVYAPSVILWRKKPMISFSLPIPLILTS